MIIETASSVLGLIMYFLLQAIVVPYLAYIVYGSAAILGAALDLVFPETLNKPSPEMSDFLPRNEVGCINSASDVDEGLQPNARLNEVNIFP